MDHQVPVSATLAGDCVSKFISMFSYSRKRAA
jgi:hypothetical protein